MLVQGPTVNAKQWKAYWSQLERGERPSLVELVKLKTPFLTPKRLQSGTSTDVSRMVIDQLIEMLADAGINLEPLEPGKEFVMDDETLDEKKLYELGMKLWEASENDDLDAINAYIEAHY